MVLWENLTIAVKTQEEVNDNKSQRNRIAQFKSGFCSDVWKLSLVANIVQGCILVWMYK